MSTDGLENNEKQTNDDALTNHNINMLLTLIATNDQSSSDDSSSEFPQEYDWSQPAKSWWRYFKKQTEQNTALCYTCGSIFNRGPKQSTTSLSHHLKMYHREQFILIQQAKDEDLRHNNNSGKFRSGTKRVQNNEESNQEDYVNRKKSAFNLALIESVRQKSELYDCRQRQTDEKQCESWEQVAKEVGVTSQIARKSWQSLSQRYRKEMKIALRDEFLYKPKWPYFLDLNFLNEHFNKSSTDMRKKSNSSANSGEYNVQNLSYLNSGNASTLLNNIFNVACAKSPLDEEENGSTDSAFASTSEHSNADQDSEQSDVQKQDSSFLTIHQLFSAPPSDDQLDDSQNSQQKSNDLPTSKRNRSRKAPPARLQKPTMEKTNESSFDWLQDEDELFGKIIALRLRTLSVEKKRQMKILIEQLFERGDS